MGEGNRDEVFFLGRLGTTPLSQLTDRLKLYAFFSSRLKYDNRGKGILDFKGRVHIFFIRELDVPPLGVPRVINDDAWHHLMTRGTLQKMLP